jgi:hypothetical protein
VEPTRREVRGRERKKEREKEREREEKRKTQCGHIKQGSEVVRPAYVLQKTI